MAKTLEIYKCNICGIMTEVLDGGDGEMLCCGEPMKNLSEKMADSSTEKHVPVVEKIDGGYKVTVGSTLHPMEEKHYIQWIELLADGKAYRQFLSPALAMWSPNILFGLIGIGGFFQARRAGG